MADAAAEAESRLYGLPLEDFTKERDALARELRKGGDRDAAAVVAKLPKPSPVAWAVNRLARDEPELVEALVRAGERLGEVQLGGEGRDALREAVAAEREAVDAAVSAARELRPGGRALSRPMTDRLRTTLHAAAGDDELRERIRAGRVAGEAEAGGAWPLAAMPAGAEREPATKGGRGKRAGTAPKRRATRDEEGERRAAAEREAVAAEREAAEREAAEREAAERRALEKALKAARAKAAKSSRRLDAARAEADAAHERLEAAREADEAARDEVARIEERLG